MSVRVNRREERGALGRGRLREESSAVGGAEMVGSRCHLPLKYLI